MLRLLNVLALLCGDRIGICLYWTDLLQNEEHKTETFCSQLFRKGVCNVNLLYCV